MTGKNLQPADRVMVYIDGFNLYFGMRQSGWRDLYWLDVGLLGRSLVRKHQSLEGVKYFTSRVRGSPAKAKRQSTYLDALQTVGGVDVYYGHYTAKEIQCGECAAIWTVYGEKKTDVNIASHLLLDAVDDRFDTAILVSGDGDLVTPVEMVQARFNKRVWMAFPPNRPNRVLEAAAVGKVRIRRHHLEASQLPRSLTSAEGAELTRPPEWS